MTELKERLRENTPTRKMCLEALARIETLEAALREIAEGWDAVPAYNRPSLEDQISTLQQIATEHLRSA